MAELDLKNYQNRHSLASKIARVIWNLVYWTLFRPTPSKFRLAIWWRILLLRLFGAKVNWKAGISSSCQIWQPWKLRIDNASIGEHVNLYSVDTITIEHYAIISAGAFLCTASHDISSPIMELTTAPITVGTQAWIAAEACLLPGVIIGEGAVVAARAVVAKEVESWTVVVGNPAKVVGKRELKEV